VLSSSVVIKTDHRALEFISKNQKLNRKFARWALALDEYRPTLEYKKGSQNANADALSRPPFVPARIAPTLLVLKCVKLSDGAQVPIQATEQAAGYDLVLAGPNCTVMPGTQSILDTGLAIELPVDHAAIIHGRSGLAKKGLMVHQGIIDADYRGKIMVIVRNHGDQNIVLNTGDRMAQLVIHKIGNTPFEEVSTLNTSLRNTNGFGSTGQKTLLTKP
jgi:dUTP pyrophosphatase